MTRISVVLGLSCGLVWVVRWTDLGHDKMRDVVAYSYSNLARQCFRVVYSNHYFTRTAVGRKWRPNPRVVTSSTQDRAWGETILPFATEDWWKVEKRQLWVQPFEWLKLNFAWYIGRIRTIWFLWTKPTWLLMLSFTQNIVRACSMFYPIKDIGRWLP